MFMPIEGNVPVVLSPPSAKFILPAASLSPEKQGSPSSSFLVPAMTKSPSSLSGKKQTRFQTPLIGVASTSPTKPSFKRPFHDSGSDSDSSSKPAKPAARPTRKKNGRKPAIPEEPSQPAAVFKMPEILDLANDSAEQTFSDGFDDLPRRRLSGDEQTGLSDEESTCPYCKEPVDPILLRGFSNGAWMSLREQETFCVAHKKKSARETWISKGYPEIDWDGFDSRLDRHDSRLRRILNGEPSHFAQILQEHIKSGKERTLLKSKHITGPGYYGPRGMRLLQEHIIRRHSSLLRERAVKDRVVSARGYGHYVQAVLVPELASLLIAEDMEVSPEVARNVMEESIKVGELLNEDVADVAPARGDDESE